jgi:hypothetical protein
LDFPESSLETLRSTQVAGWEGANDGKMASKGDGGCRRALRHLALDQMAFSEFLKDLRGHQIFLVTRLVHQ